MRPRILTLALLLATAAPIATSERSTSPPDAIAAQTVVQAPSPLIRLTDLLLPRAALAQSSAVADSSSRAGKSHKGLFAAVVLFVVVLGGAWYFINRKSGNASTGDYISGSGGASGSSSGNANTTGQRPRQT